VSHIGHDAGPAEGEGDDNELGLEEEGVMLPDVYHSRKVVNEVRDHENEEDREVK